MSYPIKIEKSGPALIVEAKKCNHVERAFIAPLYMLALLLFYSRTAVDFPVNLRTNVLGLELY